MPSPTPHRTIDADLLKPEIEFTTSRSSGPGGQNVNKVSTKVTLRFDVHQSEIITGEEKEILLNKLQSKLTTDGVLILSSQDKRTQLQNKASVVEKLNTLLARAFAKQKPRKATKPTKAAKEARLKKKKQHAEKKQWRKGI